FTGEGDSLLLNSVSQWQAVGNRASSAIRIFPAMTTFVVDPDLVWNGELEVLERQPFPRDIVVIGTLAGGGAAYRDLGYPNVEPHEVSNAVGGVFAVRSMELALTPDGPPPAPAPMPEPEIDIDKLAAALALDDFAERWIEAATNAVIYEFADTL